MPAHQAVIFRAKVIEFLPAFILTLLTTLVLSGCFGSDSNRSRAVASAVSAENPQPTSPPEPGASLKPAIAPFDRCDPGETALTSGGEVPLIAGSYSWLEGRFYWTDYPYDDRGANTDGTYPTTGIDFKNSMAFVAPGLPAFEIGAVTASMPGDVYPEDALANAADLIQLMLAFRDETLKVGFLLQTLADTPDALPGIVIDLDNNPDTGAQNLGAGDWVVTGTALGAERLVIIEKGLTRVFAWEESNWQEIDVSAAVVDLEQNVLCAEIPQSVLVADSAESESQWRVAGFVGLGKEGYSWRDGESSLYDLAFVRNQPADLASVTDPWEASTQASVLAGEADAALAVATVELGKFKRGFTELAVPEPEIKNTFMYRSGLNLGDGIQTGGRKYAGRYQPYVAWFPETLPENPPLIIFLHGAEQTHRSGHYGGGPEADPASQVRIDGVIVTPLGRAEVFGWYAGYAEQDVLDVFEDASRRFNVDQDRVVLSGYSLGGVGTFRLSQIYPDKFAGAVEFVGAADLGGLTLNEELAGIQTLPNALESLRNLKFRMGHGRLDELELVIGAVQPELAARELTDLGYDVRLWQFTLRDHLIFPVGMLQCEMEAAIARGRIKNPARVVYSVSPALFTKDPESGLDLRHDSAYWVSGVRVIGNDFSPGDEAGVDITSYALPDHTPLLNSIPLEMGGNLDVRRDVCGDNPVMNSNDIWMLSGQDWIGFDDSSLKNAFSATLRGIGEVSVDAARMGLDVTRSIAVSANTDSDVLLRIEGDWPANVNISTGNGVTPVCPEAGVVEVSLVEGDITFTISPGQAQDCAR